LKKKIFTIKFGIDKKITIFLLIFLNVVLTVVFLSLKPGKTKEFTDFSIGKFSFEELSKYFSTLANDKGAEYAYEALREAKLPENVDLHLLGHVIGDVLYKQKGAEGITVCTNDFRNACSHSIVVGLFFEKGESALSEIASICRKAPGGSGAYTMCFHGLGHGILAFNGYDLSKTVDLCSKTGTPEYRNREYLECVGGSIMEILGGGFHDREKWTQKRAEYLNDDDPLLPCSGELIPKEAKPICYVYLTPRLFELAGADLRFPQVEHFKRAFEFCDLIDEKDTSSKDACFGGLGKEFVVLVQGRDIRKTSQMTDQQLKTILEWCNLVQKEQAVRQCVFSAQQSLYWGGESDRRVSIKFCDLITSGNLRSFCFGSLVGMVDFYIKDANYKEQFCGELPAEFLAQCRKDLL